jgi:hypothetical protein
MNYLSIKRLADNINILINPFNPTTKMEYTTPKPGFISIKVYDVCGIYFYWLKARNNLMVKKIILLK